MKETENSYLSLKINERHIGILLKETLDCFGITNNLSGKEKIGFFYTIVYNRYNKQIVAVHCHSLEEVTAINPTKIDITDCPFLNFPEEIQKRMVELSSSKSIIPFLLDLLASNGQGGFTWANSPEGYIFWGKVITHRKFDLFFNNLKQNENESQDQLQEEVIPSNGTGMQGKPKFLYRKHKPRVAIGSLSYKKVSGRG